MCIRYIKSTQKYLEKTTGKRNGIKKYQGGADTNGAVFKIKKYSTI